MRRKCMYYTPCEINNKTVFYAQKTDRNQNPPFTSNMDITWCFTQICNNHVEKYKNMPIQRI